VRDEPTRARLIELNQKLLKGGDHALPENREPNDTRTSVTTKATETAEANNTTAIFQASTTGPTIQPPCAGRAVSWDVEIT
jgi:hypothetical protein